MLAGVNLSCSQDRQVATFTPHFGCPRVFEFEGVVCVWFCVRVCWLGQLYVIESAIAVRLAIPILPIPVMLFSRILLLILELFQCVVLARALRPHLA